MTASVPVPLIVIGFIAAFVLLWSFILWLASWTSGWRQLAERFGATFEYGGEVVKFVSARFGLANYSGVLILGADDQGLYLVPIWIYRLFHQPILIPWTEIEAHVYEEAVLPRVKLTFPSVPGKRILLYGRSAKECMPYLREHSGFESRSD
jgi:hypothetical protein